MTGTPSTGRALHVDTALSNLIVDRRPEGFIVDQFLPVQSVSKQHDFFWKKDHMQGRRHQPNLSDRAPGTRAKVVSTRVSTDTYAAINYALAAEWPVEDEVNADDVLAWATTNAELLMDRLMVDYEMRVADLATTSANVGTVTTIASAWSDPDNSAPFDDLNTKIEQFRQRTGKRVNTMILPEAVMTDLRRNAQLRSVLFGDNGGLVQAQQLASMLNIGQVLVPFAQVNTAGEAATAAGNGTLSDIWGPHCWLMHKNPLVGRNVDSWLTAFRWTSPLFGQPFAVRRLPFNLDTLTYRIDTQYYQAEKLVSADLGERIANVSSNA